MKLISFELYGNLAHFKNPQFNGGNGICYTFDCIHKPALLGLLGKKIGLNGLKEGTQYTEYYEKLKHLKIGIEILNKVQKEKEVINNHYGFASSETGGILNTIYELLIKPEYRIYILIDPENDIDKKLYEYLKENWISIWGDCYFGRSPYPAKFKNFVEYNDWSITDQNILNEKINTIFLANCENIKLNRNQNFEYSFLFDDCNFEPKFFNKHTLPLDFVEHETMNKKIRKVRYNDYLDFINTNYEISGKIDNLYKLPNNVYIQLN